VVKVICCEREETNSSSERTPFSFLYLCSFLLLPFGAKHNYPQPTQEEVYGNPFFLDLFLFVHPLFTRFKKLKHCCEIWEVGRGGKYEG